MTSLDEVADAGHAASASNEEADGVDEGETEDELFAVKLSPRSPDMTKSPFSFAPKDTTPLRQKKA